MIWNELHNNIQNGVRLSGQIFTVENHCSMVEVCPTELWDFANERPANPSLFAYEGWAPTESTAFPSSGWTELRGKPCLAIMFNDLQHDTKVWCHIPIPSNVRELATRLMSAIRNR